MAAALAVALTSVSHAAVVYTETFGNSTGALAAISTVGWQVHYGSGATAYSGAVAATGAINNNVGRPTNLTNIGQTQTSSSATNGFIQVGSGTAPALVWTDEYNGTVSLTRDTLDSVSFYQNSNAAVNYRVALRIDTGSGIQWFASTLLGASSTGSSTDFGTTATQLSLVDFTSSDWTQINFTSGTTLGLGTTGVALAAGNVTAFGVYRTEGQVSRFDSYVISAIPEPSGAMLFCASGFLIFLRRRRR